MKKIKTIATGVLLGASMSVNAGVIMSGGSVIDDSMGEYAAYYSFENMLNQSGLSATYTSGVTDFDTFTSSGVTHSGGDSSSWLSQLGIFSGYVTFDLGSAYTIEDFVMWNGASGINASVNQFSLTTSLFEDFSVSTLVGNFTGQSSDYGANVYDLVDTSAQYVRMDIQGNFGNGCCSAIGDVAFNVSAVPEPSTYALMLGGLGLVGFMAARRKKSQA